MLFAMSWPGETMRTPALPPRVGGGVLRAPRGPANDNARKTPDMLIRRPSDIRPSEITDRDGMINPPEGGPYRCTMNWIDGDAIYGYAGPQSAAECAHVLCHFSSGKYIFDTAMWDGEVVREE